MFFSVTPSAMQIVDEIVFIHHGSIPLMFFNFLMVLKECCFFFHFSHRTIFFFVIFIIASYICIILCVRICFSLHAIVYLKCLRMFYF
jgi:hypothetical protein